MISFLQKIKTNKHRAAERLLLSFNVGSFITHRLSACHLMQMQRVVYFVRSQQCSIRSGQFVFACAQRWTSIR